MSNSIAERAMGVTLRVKTWQARKLDKDATAEVNENHGAKSDAGRYNKLLLPKKALEPISKIVSASRAYVYANTTPWSDNGIRALLSANYFDHMEKIRDFQTEFDDAVDVFCEEYNAHREQARFELNSLFKAEDYPDVCEIREKFEFRHVVSGLPVAGDFRVDMADDEIERIRTQITDENARNVKTAMDSVWKQLLDTVSHMGNRLRDPNAKFHSTTITNIEDLIERIPRLNLTDDATLTQYAQEIKDCLVGYTAADIKQDPTVRQGVAREADRITKKMAGLFQAAV